MKRSMSTPMIWIIRLQIFRKMYSLFFLFVSQTFISWPSTLFLWIEKDLSSVFYPSDSNPCFRDGWNFSFSQPCLWWGWRRWWSGLWRRFHARTIVVRVAYGKTISSTICWFIWMVSWYWHVQHARNSSRLQLASQAILRREDNEELLI